MAIGSHYYYAEQLNYIARLIKALQIAKVTLNEHKNGTTVITSPGVLCLITPVMISPDSDDPNNIIHRIELDEIEQEG